MSKASGKSHSQLLDALKRLNFRATSGLLCLQETEKIDDNLQGESLSTDNEGKGARNGIPVEINGKSADSCSAQSINTNSTNTVTEETAGKVDLVSQVKKTVGRNKTIANKCKVFVGNIGYKVRRREFREFFGYFGKVLSSEIIEDRAKRRSRGFGFVTFSNEWEAQKAKHSTDDERMLHDRVMTVSTPTRKRKGGRQPFEQEQSLEDVLEEFKQLSLMQQKNGDNHTDSNNPSVTSISTLNDDILIHIFTYLDLKDRIRIERVCTKWKYLVLRVWPTVTHLDFKDMFSLYKGGLTDYILLRIFQRGCKNLKCLDLSASPFLLTDFAVHCIAKHCKSLINIDLSGVKVSTTSLRILAKACNKLETLILKRCSSAGEKGLWWIFKECKHLKYIDVTDNKRLTGKCFFMLPSTVESLNLSECTRLTNGGVALIGNKCCNLKSIDLSGCASLTNGAFTDLLSCSQIEKLSFKNCPQTVTGDGLEMMISRFNNLMFLDLTGCSSVNDALLFHIGRCSTNLITLNIQDCVNDVSDAGIQSLVTCDNLKELNISYIDQISNTSISQLASNGTLQTFVARSCDGITDEVVESLLNQCTNLTELDFSGCTYITDASLQHVTNHYTVPGNRCPLTLVIGGTSISEANIVKAREECQQIEIVTHDYSSEHAKLRNQRITMPQFFQDSDEEEDDDDEEEFGYDDNQLGHEYDDFLLADDPSMMDEHEWMFD